MIDVGNLVRIEYHGEPVLTTKQLADFYECQVVQIQQNFAKNSDKFSPNMHYFKLEGGELREFKSHFDRIESPVSAFASSLYLWTVRGAARHAKMLGTDEAWKVFGVLESSYFEGVKAITKPITPPDSPINDIPNDKLELLIKIFDHCNAAQFERILDKLIILTK